ncbi:EamA family transporter [Candidatus Saccharibacteria bacterium]|nr:EamA family transporter [Candidatus Saccharibacteria bacterium]
MSDIILFSGIYLFGVIISAFSQVLLKKSADVKTQSFWKQYLNLKVISAYGIFFLASFLSVYAYKVIPVTLGAILGTLEYGLVAILSYVFFKEKLTKKQILGILLIIAGIIVYSIKF